MPLGRFLSATKRHHLAGLGIFAASALLIVVLILSIVALPLRKDPLRVLADPFSPPPPPTPVTPFEKPPELTDAQKEQAKAILLATPLAQYIRLNGSANIDVMGPWFDDQGDTQQLLGVAANVSLQPPQTIEADWPTLKPGPDGQPVEALVHHRVVNLSVMGVLIDLQKGKVVRVIFVAYDGFEGPTGELQPSEG